MANYSELLNDINAAIYENNDQEIDALEVRAILREMVTSLGSGFLFKGIATPSSPGTSQAPDQNVFYLATTAGTYTYLGGLVVAAGEVAFLCYDGTWTKKSSALLSTGSIVDNTTTEDATKPLSAKQGKVLADAGAATAAEVTALGHEVDGYPTPEAVPVPANNCFINTNGATIGQTFTFGAPSSTTSNIKGFKIAVRAGDMYNICGLGNTDAVNLYVLCNSSDIVVAKLKGTTRPDGEILHIASDGTLYVNLLSYDSNTDKVEKITLTGGIAQEIEQINEDVQANKF